MNHAPCDPFDGFPLESRIESRAAAAGLAIGAATVELLAWQARRVLTESTHLHLTSIHDPAIFLERHLGESFEGAARIDSDIDGSLLDLGSGNGYPGFAVAATLPRLVPWLVEASPPKARFLDELVSRAGRGGGVVARQVQRADDLPEQAAHSVVTSRAMGDWERVLPRVHRCVRPGGQVLLWAGSQVRRVLQRSIWRQRYELTEKHPLPGRDQSWIWVLRSKSTPGHFADQGQTPTTGAD